MEGFRTARSIPFGLAAIDRHLPQGGLSCGALHEVVPEAGATPAAFGFLVALLGRTCSPPSCGEGVGVGRLYFAKTGAPVYGVPNLPTPLPTLPHKGGGKDLFLSSRLTACAITAGRMVMGSMRSDFDPRRLILVETAHRKDTLWAMEEALHSRAVAAVAGFIDQLDLKTSQRLQLAATDCGLPLFLLRPAPSPPHAGEGGEREARRRRAGASERRPPRATASA